MNRLQALYDERAKAWETSQEIRGRLDAENADRLSDEDRQTWERALDDVQRLSAEIEAEERADRLERAGMNGGTTPPNPEIGTDDDAAATYTRAFNAYLRGGLSGIDTEQRQLLMRNANPFEMRAPQASSPGSAGGYLIPTDLLSKMTETLLAFGGILGVANVMNTASGNPLQWPTNDDTAAKGRIIAENAQVQSVALTFDQETLGAYIYTSDLFLVPWSLLQDEVFDLDGFIARKAGERIGRAVSEHLAVGDGVDKPQGLFSGATVGVTGAATTTGGGGAAITYDNLIDLEHSIDPAYRNRPGVQYVLADGALAMIRKLKDGDGRPLWQPSIQAGVPSSVLGRPYTIDNDVAGPAGDARSIGFGDVKAAYIVRQVQGGQLVRLEERYADFLQTGFFAYLRLDATIDDAGAFKVFVHGANT